MEKSDFYISLYEPALHDGQGEDDGGRREEGGPVHTVPSLLARSWATIGLAGVILRNLVMSTYTRLGQPRYDIYNSGSRITIRRQ